MPLFARCAQNSKRFMEKVSQLEINNKSILEEVGKLVVSTIECGDGGGLVAQSRPTLDPMDCSLSGSSVHEIFQARILEWVAISFSRISSQPRN